MTDCEPTTAVDHQTADPDPTHPAKRLAEARKQPRLAIDDLDQGSKAHDAAGLALQAAVLAERHCRGDRDA